MQELREAQRHGNLGFARPARAANQILCLQVFLSLLERPISPRVIQNKPPQGQNAAQGQPPAQANLVSSWANFGSCKPDRDVRATPISKKDMIKGGSSMAALSPYIAQDPKRIDRTGSDGRAISAGPAGRTDTGVGNFFFPSVNCLTLLDRFLNDAS